jgi:RNA polymerase sigma-70 factor (sigma-E family)
MRRQADDDEFTALVNAVWPGLYRKAYLLVGDHQQAEDLAQTALTKTYASWHRIKDVSAAPAYAHTVLTNTVTNWFRSRSRRREQPVVMVPEQGEEHDSSTRLAVVAALADLPARQRAVIVLRYFEDLSVRHVAEALGTSEGTVKKQTFDALKRLRGRLGDDLVADSDLDSPATALPAALPARTPAVSTVDMNLRSLS